MSSGPASSSSWTMRIFWPERVVRGPLTEADRALGYTAGPITLLDARAENSGGLEVDTLDARLDWRLPLLDGRLRLYGDATYYIRQVQTAPFRNDMEQVGYLGRPLARRRTSEPSGPSAP